jgi:hypothetical protein
MAEIAIKSVRGSPSFAIVDDEDIELVSAFKWNALKGGQRKRNWFYATTRVDGRKLLAMHRLVMGAKKGQFIDHINGDTLDNRKSNLRFCTKAENTRNRAKSSTSTNKYKGVCRSGKKFKAVIRVNGAQKTLGCFHKEEYAALVYDMAAIEYYGDFARPNFTPEVRRFLLCMVDFYNSPQFALLAKTLEEKEACAKNFKWVNSWKGYAGAVTQ